MKTSFLVILFVFFTSCTKTDPFPEQRDEIYRDLQIEHSIIKKDLETETKILEGLRAELARVVPQTGQIKYATTKVRQSEGRVATLEQQKLYFEIKLETRKSHVQARHEESQREGGRPWPDAAEIEAYRNMMKLNRDKIAWAKTKGVKKSVPRGTKVESN